MSDLKVILHNQYYKLSTKNWRELVTRSTIQGCSLKIIHIQWFFEKLIWLPFHLWKVVQHIIYDSSIMFLVRNIVNMENCLWYHPWQINDSSIKFDVSRWKNIPISCFCIVVRRLSRWKYSWGFCFTSIFFPLGLSVKHVNFKNFLEFAIRSGTYEKWQTGD